MEKNGDSKTAFEDLPEEAAVNVLTRLPIKTLIRSTSVCKTWYSKITNPSFISAHIQHSLSCCDQNVVLVIPKDNILHKYCSLISADNGDVLKKYKVPFETKNGSLQLCGAFNGILCLNAIEVNVDCEYQDLYLWSPSVGKYRTLFSSCFKKRGVCVYALGLGVYEPTFDFRVVRIVYPADDRGYALGKVPPKAEVYSLKRNTWRKIKDPGVGLVGFNTGVTVGNNMTYWLNTRGSRGYNEHGWLLLFDFNNEVFGMIKFPDKVRYCLGVKAEFRLLKVEGKLAVCVVSHRENTDRTCCQPCCIWLMSHVDAEVSWNLRFRIELKKHEWPLSVSRGGTVLMGSPGGSSTGLASLNLSFVDSLFVESLLMLEGRDELLKSA